MSNSLFEKLSGASPSPYPTATWGLIFYYVPLHFSNKEFEILDLEPPINATSHYSACHFRYNLALKGKNKILLEKLNIRTFF